MLEAEDRFGDLLETCVILDAYYRVAFLVVTIKTLVIALGNRKIM